MSKQLLGKGVFVRNDINGKPCRIGDRVKLTRPYMCFPSGHAEYSDADDVEIEEKIFIGVLKLRMSIGVIVSLNTGGFAKPKLSESCYSPWKWELIK